MKTARPPDDGSTHADPAREENCGMFNHGIVSRLIFLKQGQMKLISNFLPRIFMLLGYCERQ